MPITANWIQAATYSAKVDRVITANIFDEGVQRGLKTTAGGTTRDVSIAAGSAAIAGDDSADQGAYLVFNDAAATVAIGAAPGAGTRIDLVVLRINDPAAGGPAGSTATLTVVVGTVDAGAPAVPTSAIPICEVSIAAGQVVIGTAQVTDRRMWGGPKRPVGEVTDWYGPAARIPFGNVEMTGQVLGTVAAYPDLADLLGLTSGSITLPDARGKVAVAFDASQTEFDLLGEVGGFKTHSLTAGELAAHSHSTPAHAHSIAHDHAAFTSVGVSNDHSHANTAAAANNPSAPHTHGPGGGTDILFRDSVFFSGYHAPAGATGLAITWTPATAANDLIHSHTITMTNPGQSVDHTHTIDVPAFTGTTDSSGASTTGSAGSGTAHNNLQPYVVLRKLLRVLF